MISPYIADDHVVRGLPIPGLFYGDGLCRRKPRKNPGWRQASSLFREMLVKIDLPYFFQYGDGRFLGDLNACIRSKFRVKYDMPAPYRAWNIHVPGVRRYRRAYPQNGCSFSSVPERTLENVHTGAMVLGSFCRILSLARNSPKAPFMASTALRSG